ncbi:MAG: hypothetical protein LBB98_03610, partial [Treponema sp.]|nr:hypothetical protein [Treponema sp.]
GGFNRPLRGYDGSWSNFKGIGKVDLDAEGRASAIKKMTSLIDKSSYDVDIWLQRGVETSQGAAKFLDIPESALKSQSTLENLLIKGARRKLPIRALFPVGAQKAKVSVGTFLTSTVLKGQR